MSIFELLFERAFTDLGVQTFLSNVFLLSPSLLKSYCQVCSKWNTFIQENIWNNVKHKRYLQKILNKNLLSNPVQELSLKLDIDLVKGVHDCVNVVCDDDLALVDVSNLDAANLLVVNLHNFNKKFLNLGGFDATRGERLLCDLGGTFFCTAFSHRHKIEFWNKDGSLEKEFLIDENLSYIRKIIIFGNTIYVISKFKIFIIKNADFDISRLAVLDLHNELGTTRTVFCEGSNGLMFYTAHDHCVKTWNLDEDDKKAIKTLRTGLVVDMVVKNKMLITVGSLNSVGVTFWDLAEGVRLHNFLPKGFFYEVKLRNNHMLLKGNLVVRTLIDIDKPSLQYNEESFNAEADKYDVSSTFEHEHVDISPTKVVSLDFDSGSLIFRDYWNYNLDLDVSDIKSNGKNKVMKFFSKLKLRS